MTYVVSHLGITRYEDLIIDKNSFYYQTILKSPFIFKIKGKVNLLFEQWVVQVKQSSVDDLSLLHVKEDMLVNDLVLALAKGLELVWRKENSDKRLIPEWSVGVLLDTAAVSLTTHWSSEYIYKQTPDYQDLCLLKSLSQFLKLDALAVAKVEALYQHKMSKIAAPKEQPAEVNSKIVDLTQVRDRKKPGLSFQKKLTDYLDSLYYQQHFLVLGNILKTKVKVNLADNFNSDALNDLIKRAEHR